MHHHLRYTLQILLHPVLDGSDTGFCFNAYKLLACLSSCQHAHESTVTSDPYTDALELYE